MSLFELTMKMLEKGSSKMERISIDLENKANRGVEKRHMSLSDIAYIFETMTYLPYILAFLFTL